MIPYREALAILRAAADEAGRLPYASVPLKDAVGRVTAASVAAEDPLPPFDNSSMDGYAVSASDVNGEPLKILGRIAAGDAPLRAEKGGAYEITTGAPLPEGCDAVARVEDCELADDGARVAFKERPAPGDYVRRRGADVPAGSTAVASGTLVEPRHLLALAALGVDRVPVRRRPKIALIATGKELVEPSLHPGPGQIRDATGAYLSAAFAALSCELDHRGIVRDDPADFARRLDAALDQEPDVVVTTGAVSMGRHDFIPRALEEHGAEVLFHKTAIRPGKPLLAARLDRGSLLFGLPGNPISTVVGLRFFIEPYLRRLLGRPDEAARRLALAAPVDKPEGLRCFFKARLEDARARVLEGQASFQIEPLLAAGCWAVLPEEGARLEAGAEVEVYPL